MSERRSELKAVNSAAEQISLPARDAGLLAAQWADNWSQINGRLVAMAQAGLRTSLNAAEQLRACQSPAEVLDIQIKLARQVYDDYLDEARGLSELVMKMSTEALASAAAAAPQLPR